MKSIYRLLLVALCATIAFTSCVTPSQVNYLQDMRHGSQIELENKFQAKICPYDELDIYVFGPSGSEELAKPFNISSSNISAGTMNRRGAYLVDVNGNIQFPVLGTMHVAGMTRLELQDAITNRLDSDNLLKSAVVMVRFANFKIFFLGAEGGKSITISNERCTFLEALALCGDLSVYTNRNKIAVMREVNGKMVMRYLDPRSSSVFQDPFFMLQQNDFIITQNYNTSTTRQEARNFVSMWVSTAMSTLTLALTIMNLLKK
jgi:polysaccharide export outer membrane protein